METKKSKKSKKAAKAEQAKVVEEKETIQGEVATAAEGEWSLNCFLIFLCMVIK
jgi:hypothetical protein